MSYNSILSKTISYVPLTGSQKIHGYFLLISAFGGGETISEGKNITCCINFVLVLCDKEHSLLCIVFLWFELCCK